MLSVVVELNSKGSKFRGSVQFFDNHTCTGCRAVDSEVHFACTGNVCFAAAGGSSDKQVRICVKKK